MNTGTALVGFMLSFLAGSGLTWGVAEYRKAELAPSDTSAEPSRQASSPIPIGSDDPSWGSATAPVTVVVLSDFECPYCSRAVPTLARVEKEYRPEQVRVVWKHYPLESHPNARPAAEAAAAVRALGGDFWKFHDLAFGHQRELSRENFARWAVEAGVDSGRFEAELKSLRPAAKVDRDISLARQLGINGTPHFKINGKTLSGAQPFDKFKQLIDEQLTAADALAKTGVRRADLSLELTKKNFAAPPAEPRKGPPAPPPVDTTVWKVPVAADDPVSGPADALVTLIEFSDFQCPYCSKVGPSIERLRQEYPRDLRVVWKDLPMSFHPRAKPAAFLSRFAYDERGNDGFWKVHDALFEDQKNLDDESLLRTAEKVGLDTRRARAALGSTRYTKKIDESVALASDFAIPGTPHFFINGRRVSGLKPYEDFKRLVDEQLALARALVDKGVPRAAVFQELMKSAKAPPEPEKKTVAAPTRDNPSRGPDKARVTITEFSDFQCPFCSRATPTMEQLLAAYPKDVRLVWRHLPLSFHPNAPLAAEAAQEAFAQGGNEGFWKYHDTLFQNQKALARPDLERYAREQGLDLARFNAALDSHKHKPHVDRDSQEAQRASITGTPGFIINGYFVSGAYPFETFDRLVRKALQER
ncbi:MAG TPA: thioredoxin domain-containing protein [Polyangiaceae bacterium]|nr:thioredoxin domain-containing protein [Polyangiaceae bacterium]